MARVIMYITIILTIGVLAPLFGVETTSLMIWDTVASITQDSGDFILNSFRNNPFWTTLVGILAAFGVGAVFIGTAFKIPLELIALIPLAVLLIAVAGDLMAINSSMTTLCVDTSSQLGCFMQPIVFLLSIILFVGYVFTLISWWAGRNA